MKEIFFLILAAVAVLQPAAEKRLAVTIDDLPFVAVAGFSVAEQERMFIRILAVLKKHHVRVLGFVIGRNITDLNRHFLENMRHQGHALGNHSYSHPDLNNTTVAAFVRDIQRGQETIKPWLGAENYFRYPMLHRGDTEEKHRAVALFLKQHRFKAVPVTIDNDEWRYNRDYAVALKSGDQRKMKQIGSQYIKHMQEETRRNVDLAREKLGRDVSHILLIHMNAINADYLDKLLTWYRGQGWRFIPVEDALEDPVYSYEDLYIGKWGWSWLRRIAAQQD